MEEMQRARYGERVRSSHALNAPLSPNFHVSSSTKLSEPSPVGFYQSLIA